jgi:hypothetical protein
MSPEPTRVATTSTPHELAPPRFDAGSESLVDWIASLRAAGVRQAGPALLLALEGLRRADLAPSRRFSVLHLLKAPLLKTCAGLPKPRDRVNPNPTGLARGVTVEQRLYRLMFQNVNQALRQLDRCYFMLNGRQERRREWAVRNLFRFFDRQLRYASLWGAPLPEGAWRDLHELYVYLTLRREPRPSGPVVDIASRSGDSAREYKQILLFGLAARLAPSSARSGPLLEGLREWALQTQLQDTQGKKGEVGAFVVDLAQDIPPYRQSGPLDPAFRGWVLVPPDAFLELLDRSSPLEGGTPRLPPEEKTLLLAWS